MTNAPDPQRVAKGVTIHDGSWRLAGYLRPVTNRYRLSRPSHQKSFAKRDRGNEPQVVYTYPWKSWRIVTIRDESPIQLARTATIREWRTVTAVKQPCTLMSLMPRLHQSLNMFKSSLVKHGLKLFSLSKLLAGVFFTSNSAQIEKHALSSSKSCIKAWVVVFL